MATIPRATYKRTIMNHPNPLSMSAPSRVTSVAELRRLGAQIPNDADFDDSCLAEVRPHPTFDPNERADLMSRGVRRFLATVETERNVLNIDVEMTDKWFVELMPLRILANVPEDISSLTGSPTSDSLSTVLAWNPEVARGFATGFLEQWGVGRSPKKKTRAFLTAVSVVRPSVAPMLTPAIRLLSTPSAQRLNKFQRRMVTDALELVIQVCQANGGEG